MIHDNRESWLNGVAAGMALLFEALGAPLPDRVRVAIGFTSAGRGSRAIGECWDNRRSADGHFEIFIRLDLAHAPDAMPAQIAAILAHDLLNHLATLGWQHINLTGDYLWGAAAALAPTEFRLLRTVGEQLAA